MKLSFFRLLFLFLPLLACSTPSSTQNIPRHENINPIPKDKRVHNVTGQPGGTLVLDLSGNPQTFNPLLSTDVISRKVYDQLFSSLVKYDLGSYTYEPLLAKSIQTSADGLTYTFSLREGILWSDGLPLTADDVVFTYKIVEQEKSAGARYTLMQDDDSLPQIEKIDGHTVVFHLKKINVLFLAGIGEIKILPYHKYGQIVSEGRFSEALKTNTPPADIVGSGPFVLADYIPDQRLVLKPNPHYFGFDKNGIRLPYYQKLVRLIVPDMQAEYIKFANGETDMHEVEVENYDPVKAGAASGDYTVFDLGPSLEIHYLSCLQNPDKRADGVTPIMEAWKYRLFSDKRFRQALSYAIDRPSFINAIFHGRGQGVSTFSSPGNKTWYPQDLPPYPYDLAKAKALLAELGLQDSDGDGILEYEPGQKISFTIHTNSENQKRIQIGNLVKEDFKKIGLDASLVPVPFNSLVDMTDTTLNYDCYILGWTGSVPPDPIMAKKVLLSSGNLHDWHAKQATPSTDWEAKIDNGIQLLQSTLDEKKRVNIWHDIEKIWYEEQPQIMIGVPNKSVAIKNKIGNAKPSPYMPYYEWNLEELYDKTAPTH